MVDDVLQHHDQTRSGDGLMHARKGRTRHRGESAPVNRIARDLLGDLGRDDVHGGIRMRRKQRVRVVEPLLLHQKRARGVTGPESASDDLRRLRDVQTALRLAHASERDVGQVAVVPQPGIPRIVHAFDPHVRLPSSALT